ncbi:NifU family protein [Bacillus thuringiensis]|uniref:NifU family protein n=1 Tax=Bacillus thuringiensis TaxID=1428 RepID=UPI00119E4F0B|nr:NifU family protein [Bacillus thuringiensis]
MLVGDGGEVELVEIEEGMVKLGVMGGWGRWGSCRMTVKGGIEGGLLEEVAGVMEVEEVF